MAGLLKTQLIGNLGADAELRKTQGGRSVLSWRMAVNITWKNNEGEQQERTVWVKCDIWGKRAEGLAPYLTKGKGLYVEGEPRADSWVTEDGELRQQLAVRVNVVEFLPGGGNGNGRRDDDDGYDYSGVDDLPF